MKSAKYIGNVTIVVNKQPRRLGSWTVLVLKPKKDISDTRRKRKRVGYGLWVPPGGGTEPFDKNQKHAAQRELMEETGLRLPLRSFHKVGILKGFLDDTGRPTWLVHLYLAKTKGLNVLIIPGEGLMKAHWFPTSKLPFKRMLAGDRDWIPKIIAGKKLIVSVHSKGDTNAIKTWRIERVNSFN